MNATLRIARTAARTLTFGLVLGGLVGNLPLILVGLTGCVLMSALRA